MNELERQIRELALREPGDTMDRQVLSLLYSSGDTAARETGHEQCASSGDVKGNAINESTRARRVFGVTTVAGFVAALLIGFVVGNGLPSFWSIAEQSTADDWPSSTAHETVMSNKERESEWPTRHPMMPELSMGVREALQNRSTVGSQFVESSSLSAISGAAAWERQNGEVFNVTTHVSDRRFDMCRDCHRVGG